MCLKSRAAALILVGLLTLTLCAAANAAFVMDRNTELVGNGALQHLSLYSLVTEEGGVYTYSYDLTFDAGTTEMHLFSVANWEDLPFFGSANNWGFTDPAYTPGDGEVKWFDGTMSLGQTAHFSYQSVYGPSEIDVYAYVVDGGDSADGTALGMTTEVPEPSSIAGLALAIAGFAPVIRRRR